MTTNGNVSTAAKLDLAPYVFFSGRCAEALEFYKGVFGGSYESQRNSEAPAEMQQHIPEGQGNRIMHARFQGPGFEFMCSDGRETKPVDPDAGNVSLALSASDADSGRRIFDALAEGGKVVMPLDTAFWGGKFGIAHDKFGIEWFVTAP